MSCSEPEPATGATTSIELVAPPDEEQVPPTTGATTSIELVPPPDYDQVPLADDDQVPPPDDEEVAPPGKVIFYNGTYLAYIDEPHRVSMIGSYVTRAEAVTKLKMKLQAPDA